MCPPICPLDRICGIGKIITGNHHTCLEMPSVCGPCSFPITRLLSQLLGGSDVLSICHALRLLVAFLPHVNQHHVSPGHWCSRDGHTNFAFSQRLHLIFLGPEGCFPPGNPPIRAALAA